MIDPQLSTGLPGLDRVFKGLIPGDNLVWQVDSLADFAPFVAPFCEAAQARGRKLIYFRFADHEPLAPEALGATVHHLHTTDGFEQFITQIHEVIQDAGPGAYFVFDCLSILAEAWCSDRMLGNFFLLTCPYVYDRQSIAYFPFAPQLPLLSRLDPHRQDHANPGRRLPASRAALSSIRPRCSTATRPRCTCCTSGTATSSCRSRKARRSPRSSPPGLGPAWTRSA